MAAIFKRELSLLFGGWRAWTYLAITLAVGGVMCFMLCIYSGSPSFHSVVPMISIAYILTSPLIAMDAFPGDRRRGTDRLMASLPVRPAKLVAGKFLALMVPVAAASALMAVLPVSLMGYGELPMAEILAALVMHCLLGAALTAAALFMSSLSGGQFVAFLSAAALIAAMYFAPDADKWLAATTSLTGVSMVAMAGAAFVLVWLFCRDITASVAGALIVEAGILISRFAGQEVWALAALRGIAAPFAAFDRLTPFVAGLFDWSAVFYYLTAAALFLCLADLAAAMRAGWKGAKAR